MATDDQLAVELAKIRDRASHVSHAIATESPRQFSIVLNSQSDVPRLAAAVEAVLHLTEQWTDIACVVDPADASDAIRGAISGALLREDGTDG